MGAFETDLRLDVFQQTPGGFGVAGDGAGGSIVLRPRLGAQFSPVDAHMTGRADSQADASALDLDDDYLDILAEMDRLLDLPAQD